MNNNFNTITMNDNFNTITLLHGWERLLNKTEMPKFRKGDTIWGNDNDPEELKRWPIEEMSTAFEELEKYRCSYDTWGHDTVINEYALCFFEADEEGDFVQGCDYWTAEEAEAE